MSKRQFIFDRKLIKQSRLGKSVEWLKQEEWPSAGFLFHKAWLFACPSGTYKLHVLSVETYDEIWTDGCLSNRNSLIGKL
jgi:hypothetical protein